MIPELGLYALILATLVALFQASVPLVGWWGRYSNLLALAKPLAQLQFILLLLSFLMLMHSFLTNDFSVAYVATQSNTLLPWYYQISAIWGGHEGSMLLWVLMLAGWACAVSMLSRALPKDLVAVVLSVLGMVSLAFLLFTVLTSNPFARMLPDVPLDGRDLNPLLQDIGLILHPPMLYMGYVGYSVVFAFAVAALITGRLDSAWARWVRPWTDIAWVFLTLGIALGSWWAYYELGWGGWWFWDPVENASLIPWLVGTALMHSLAVTEKRQGFKVWTLLLSLFTFAFVILGTFLVRSGILTSVHAFANDPARGQFILGILLVTVCSSLLLFAIRAPLFKDSIGFKPLSREGFLLINNVILVTTAFVITVLTLMPLLWPVLGLGQISVGPPVFNMAFNPLFSLLICAMGVGQLLRWKSQAGQPLVKPLLLMLVASLVFSLLFVYFYKGQINALIALATALAYWIFLSSAYELKQRLAGQGSLLVRIKRLPPSFYGMLLGHIGVVLVVLGASYVTQYEQSIDVRMGVGDQRSLLGYDFVVEDFVAVQGSNWQAEQANVLVFRQGRQVASLTPQKRDYFIAGQVMTQAGIQSRLHRDLYVSMGEPLANGDWSLRLQVKPWVSFLWLGAMTMALGGLLAVFDRRYRRRSA